MIVRRVPLQANFIRPVARAFSFQGVTTHAFTKQSAQIQKSSTNFHINYNSSGRFSAITHVSKANYCTDNKDDELPSSHKSIPASKFDSIVKTEKTKRILDEERAILLNLMEVIPNTSENIEEDSDLLKKAIKKLDELFLLVVVGEFNSGKSSFLNALLGEKFLTQGITPTTQKIGVIKYGERKHNISDSHELESIHLPIPWLREINVVDTPGTNAIIRGHELITEHFIPQADLVLFVTSIERPLTESERIFLEKIGAWNKKIVVIVTKVDHVENPGDLTAATDYISHNFEKLTGAQPRLFPISSKLTLLEKLSQPIPEHLSVAANEFNQFKQLEEYIHKTLDADHRLELKLSTPVGICRRLLEKYTKLIEHQEAQLRLDVDSLKTVEQYISHFVNEMNRDFVFQQSRVDNILLHLKERGEHYLTNKLHLSNFFNLLSEDRFREDFEREVIRDTTRDIDSLISDIIDWLVDKNTNHWKRVLEAFEVNINSRHAPSPAIGKAISFSEFQLTRKELLSSIGTSISDIIKQYNKDEESKVIAQKVHSSVIQTATIAGVGALGLGAMLSISLFDITGLLGASALAVGGLCVLPYRRATFKKYFAEKVETLRTNLNFSLKDQFENEINNSCSKIRLSIAPFSAYVAKEQTRITELKTSLTEIETALNDLEKRLQTIPKN